MLLFHNPVVKINFTGAAPDPNISLASSMYSQTAITSDLVVSLPLPSTSIIGSSEIGNTLLVSLPLTTSLYSNTSIFGAVHSRLGQLDIGVEIYVLSPTSYTKGVPRPIAYLKNDNDNIGSFSQAVESSPSDFDF